MLKRLRIQLKYHRYYIITAITGWALAAFSMTSGIGHEEVKSMLSETANSQLAQAMFYFTVASYIHGNKTKKSIEEAFTGLKNDISKFANNFREKLDLHTAKHEELVERVDVLDKKGEANA